MERERLVALSDGIIAVIMTIMVLELKTPVSGGWSVLWSDKFIILSYLISFFNILLFWIIHQNIFRLFKFVPMGIVWINAVLLFTLSFLPFTTAWVGNFVGDTAAEITFVLNSLFIDLGFWWLLNSENKVVNEEKNVSAKLGKQLDGNIKGIKLTAINHLIICGFVFLWAPLGIILVMLILSVWITMIVKDSIHNHKSEFMM